MAGWRTDSRDKWFPTFYPHGRFKFGTTTYQGGTVEFTRKKKNGCKLVSSGEIRREVAKSTVFGAVSKPPQIQAPPRVKYLVVFKEWPEHLHFSVVECESYDHAARLVRPLECGESKMGRLNCVRGTAHIIKVPV